jgi:hypothetical protein
MNEFERKTIDDIKLINIIVLCELLEESLREYKEKYNSLTRFYAITCHMKDQLEMIVNKIKNS